MKDPNKIYTSEDLKNYQKIILKTNAFRKYYQANNKIEGNRSKKYKQIIAPFFGDGIDLMQINNKKIDYVYWNDINELVQRLRLLIASQSAGNTGHANEINSIIEELREAKIIA